MKQEQMRKTRGVFEKEKGSGVWWIEFYVGHRRVRKKAGTWANARDLYSKTKTEVLQGKILPEKTRKRSVTFGELAKKTLEYSKAKKRTYYDDVLRMEVILGWFRDVPADSITAEDIEKRFAEAVEQEQWAASTINHYRSLISLTYRLAIKDAKSGIVRNPARETEHRKEPEGRVRYLKPEEETALRKVIAEKYPEHEPELTLALNTGMRSGEMYNLDWSSVNIQGRILAVERSKNGRRRYIRLNKGALSALATFAKRSNGTGRVVRNAAGFPLGAGKHWFLPATKEAGIADFHFHDLRHTFASRLAMAGESLRGIMEVMGHKTAAMSVRYSHLSPDFQLASVERLDSYNATANGESSKAAEATKATSTATTTATRDISPVLEETVIVQ